MGFLQSFNLSLVSLLVVFFLPFSYFLYHSKYAHRAASLRRVDFVLSAAAYTLCVLVLLKVALQARSANLDFRLLGLLHLGPLLLTLLIVGHNRKAGRAAGAAAAQSGGETGYKPIPLNSEIEKLSWDDLVISKALKQELLSVIELLKAPATAKRYGIAVPKGILFQGPPGTGKTSIAKVVAGTAKLSFFALRMDEVVSKWVGESEKNLSILFEAAQRNAPAVIFIDEVDSIGKSRSGGGAVWADNLLNHLLQLIDGVVKVEGLYIIAATNRSELVDEALKRPGRLNKVIEIPLPDFEGRKEIFRRNLARLPLAGDVDLEYLAGCTVGQSGAVIKEICNQAGLNAFQRESHNGKGKRDYSVNWDDIDGALYEFVSEVPPDVEDKLAV